MIKKLSLIGILIVTCSYTQPKHCKLSDRIMASYTKELKSDKGLQLIAKGGAMRHDVKEIVVHYVSFEKMDVDQARSLYVGIMEEYLKRYNEDENIRPYLHNYPFVIDNIDLKLSFYDETQKFQKNGLVALIYKIDDKILYRADTGEKFYSLGEEPYEKALEIVNGLQRAGVP